MSELILLEEAEDVCDELLYEIFRIELAKADDPRTRRGFAAAVASLFRSLRRRMVPDEREAEDKAIEDLDRDWSRTSEPARARLIDRAASRIAALGRTLAPKLGEVWRRHIDRIIRATRRVIASAFNAEISLAATAFDQQLVNWIVGSQTNFVTNEYGRRAIALSRRARKIVANGIRRGAFRDDLTRELARDVKLTVTGRSQWYYDVSSRIYINRGRTLSSLSSYRDAGFDRYEISATMDARTSDVCRLLHGKIFTVASGLQQFEEMSQLDNPEGVRDLAPFVINGLDRDGNEALIFNRNGRRRVLARVVQSGVGEPGERGKFADVLSDDALRSNGILAPPYHGSCRTSIVPVA